MHTSGYMYIRASPMGGINTKKKCKGTSHANVTGDLLHSQIRDRSVDYSRALHAAACNANSNATPCSQQSQKWAENSLLPVEKFHWPQALALTGSRMSFSGGNGRKRKISFLHINNLQQPLVQGLLGSDTGCSIFL